MVKVRYIGDGDHYVPGHPAIEGQIEEVTADEAAALVDTGLYERVAKESSKKAEADGAAGGDPS
jgi:hypothetical protein